MPESKMVETIEAIFDGEVLRPKTTLRLEPNTRVRITIENREAEPTYLYHYTTAEGFKGIVESQEIWATSIKCLNDPSEFYYGRDAYEELIRAALQDVGDDFHQLILNDALMHRGYDSLHTTFVCSFSTDGDDLSQWRAYGREGGFAIGLPRLQLQWRATECGYWLRRCDYGMPSPGDIHKLIEEISDAMGNHGPSGAILAARQLMFILAGSRKHHGFRSEQEWRAILCDQSPSEIRYRKREEVLVPYVACSLNDPELWEHTQIVVGPGLPDQKELRLESAKMFLKSKLEQHKLPTTCVKDVRSSDIPCRTKQS
jgi:predicted DNA-binding antitoxin AbrB/MazE fold protein